MESFTWQNENGLSWVNRSENEWAKASVELEGSPRAAASSFSAIDVSNSNSVSVGTTIRFFDEALCHGKVREVHGGGLFFCASGSRESGKTTILIALASSYLVTMWKQRENCSDVELKKVKPPSVIIVDTEHGMNIAQIVAFLRAATLKCLNSGSEKESISNRLVENVVTELLSFLHIAKVNDASDFCTLLENLRHCLDENVFSADAMSSRLMIARAPDMLLIDTLNSWEANNVTKVLSTGYNDYMRQLQRLISAHPSLLVYASHRETCATHHRVKGNLDGDKRLHEVFYSSNPLSRMITHHVILEKSNVSNEDAVKQNSHDFLARMHRLGHTMSYSLTEYSISC